MKYSKKYLLLKLKQIIFLSKDDYNISISIPGGGADPKSPVGTAASFSKANKYALKLANTSLFLEFATNELINTIGTK